MLGSAFRISYRRIDVVANVAAAEYKVEKVFCFFEYGVIGLQSVPGDGIRFTGYGDVFCQGEFLNDPYLRPVAAGE